MGLPPKVREIEDICKRGARAMMWGEVAGLWAKVNAASGLLGWNFT